MFIILQEQLQRYFWSRVTEELGEVQRPLRNLLNQQGISASILVNQLNDEGVVKFLEEAIESQREQINQYAEERGLALADFFPGGSRKFTFSLLDKIMLGELAQLVKVKGIKQFLPPPGGPRQDHRVSQPGPCDYDKEVDNLRTRLQGRYVLQ